ncbi:MAG: outer membrane beta-barrel protein [Bryobacteraceae bacterium]
MKRLAAVLLCLSAQAQTYEVGVHGGMARIKGTPLGSLRESGERNDDSRLKGQSAAGVRFTLNTKGYWGQEVGYIYNRARFVTRLAPPTGSTTPVQREAGVVIHQAFYNVVSYFMPAGERWRPFFTTGLELHENGAPNIAEFTSGRTRNYGFNYGGGVKIRLAPRALVRFDVRDTFTGKPYGLRFEDDALSGGLIRQFEVSAGLSVTF